MRLCPSCAFEYEGDFRFCPNCATPLAGRAPVSSERKVVTALFCDLVGFTALSQAADPEDVDRTLATYFEMARSQIESHGGVVEKFIGDAVVGVFGVPAAHEDDPERAVRAGLAICAEAESLTRVGGGPLRMRTGINTGEALVHLGVPTASGEGFLRGDAINTASRIQSVAPEMGVAVGLATYEATSRVFEYEELEAARLKGKTDPVRVFHAKRPRGRFGSDLTRIHGSPFVGRETALETLEGAFDTTLAESSPQLVIVIGEPGIVKSRLVAELGGHIDELPDVVTWRQGRCPPYGQGVTFWGLGEVVKAHAGILESDPPDVAVSKLDGVLPGGTERPWFRQRLIPLLGIESSSQAERDELFTAWCRFFEFAARDHPTVVVLEDLHWADDAMLAFLEHLTERAEGVPLLIVGTARPELFERRPDYAVHLRNATAIRLDPLTTEETARLVSALLPTSVVAAELQIPILEGSAGNPLFAEEFVRLLQDKRMIIDKGSGWELAEDAQVPFPDSVQALIAARLDTLPTDVKSLLADAAVVGKVFWAGVLASMGERDLTEVVDILRELTRKELVRPARLSSIDGEAEYSFRHVLARDVAYGQLTRGSRASRHVGAARWIESVAKGRIEDVADVLAHHYGSAFQLVRVAGETERAGELAGPAFRFLSLAGERALGLDANAAFANLDRALELAAEEHPARAEALARFGQAALHAGRVIDAVDALDEAVAIFRDREEVTAAAKAMGVLANALALTGDSRAWDLPAEALALLEPLGASAALVGALTEVARVETLQARELEAIRVADRAIAAAAQLGLPRPARALGYRGLARAERGDPGWLEDFREAISLSKEAGEGREVALLLNNLATELWAYEGPAAGIEGYDEGVAYAKPRGLTEMADTLAMGRMEVLVEIGELDAALILATELVPRLEGRGDVWDLVAVRATVSQIMALRGEALTAAEMLDWLEDAARSSHDLQLVAHALGGSAIRRAGLGQRSEAVSLLREVEAYPGSRRSLNSFVMLPGMVRAAIQCGEPGLAGALVEECEVHYPYAEHALAAANAALAEVRGDLEDALHRYEQAADRWTRFGVIPEHAFALLGQGRCLVHLSRRSEAADSLRGAREIFERLQAVPALTEIDNLPVGPMTLGS